MGINQILIDTNAYVAFKNNDSHAVDVVRQAPWIGICSIVLGELLCGFALGNKEAKNIGELDRFLTSDRVHSVPIVDETAKFYAAVYKKQKRKGRPIPTNDMWIAAIAFQYLLPVFTYDAHFASVEGLVYGNQVSELFRKQTNLSP